MPITEAERHLVYEVFEIPNATSVLNVNGDYGTGTRLQNHAVLTTKTEIDAILDGLAAEPLSRLQELLLEWKRVSTKSTRLKPMGSNEGVDVNPARTRRLIKKRIYAIVPVRLETHDAGAMLPG